MVGSLSAWLAGVAALLHVVALVVGIGVLRRLASSPLTLVLAGAGALMVVRRLLEAGLTLATRPTIWHLVHDSAGLAISALATTGLGLVFLNRRRSRPRDAPPAELPAGAAEIAAAREEEREVLSYDLHDGLSQYVLAAQMHLDTFAALRTQAPERAEEELDHARLRLREAAREVHRVVSALALRVSPEMSLTEAIRQHLDQLCDTRGWECELHDELGGQRFPRAVETMVFRVVQEALANAARHAQTDRVVVHLAAEAGCLVASVRDWGIGFEPELLRPNPRCVGLRSMCSRARLLGGGCDIESAPGMGTRVTVRIPWATQEVDGNGC